MKKLSFLLSVVLLFFASCETVFTDLGSTVDTEITSDYLSVEADLTTYMGDMEVVRLKGKPGVEVFHVGTGDLSEYEPCFILYIATGAESAGTVSSAIIKFDGVEILNTSDFSGDVYKEYKFEICNLNVLSTLEVEIRGEPGSYLDIWINGKPLDEDPFAGDAGTFTDSRDGHVYNWVRIGEQIWMAENLAYLPEVSSPYDGSSTAPYYYVNGYDGTNVSGAKATDNYSTYGVLYNWPAATLETTCPDGWHLPTDEEWKQLEMAIGMSRSEADDTGWRGTNEGTKLKATIGWYDNGNGTDDFGFSALPGGQRDGTGDFGSVGQNGYWWSATESSSPTAWDRTMCYYYSALSRYGGGKIYGLSVRCVRN